MTGAGGAGGLVDAAGACDVPGAEDAGARISAPGVDAGVPVVPSAGVVIAFPCGGVAPGCAPGCGFGAPQASVIARANETAAS